MKNEWCFRPQSCPIRLNWAGDNLGKWDEFWYESCPWYRIDRLTSWPALQRTTTVLRLPPICKNESSVFLSLTNLKPTRRQFLYVYLHVSWYTHKIKTSKYTVYLRNCTLHLYWKEGMIKQLGKRGNLLKTNHRQQLTYWHLLLLWYLI